MSICGSSKRVQWAWNRSRLPRALVAGVVAIVAAAFGYAPWTEEARAAPAADQALVATGEARAVPALPAVVLVLGIANLTGDPFFDGTLNSVLASALERSSRIRAYTNDGTSAPAVFGARPFDETLARSMAQDRGVTVLTIRGAVTSQGIAYSLSVSAKDAATGDVVYAKTIDRVERSRVVRTAGVLMSELRVDLGDYAPSATADWEQTGMSPSIEADYNYLASRRSLRARGFSEAYDRATSAIAIDPKFSRARMTLASILLVAGRYEEGNAQIRAALPDIVGVGERDPLELAACFR